MQAVVEQMPVAGQLRLTIDVTVPVHYSAAVARRIVGRFVADEISYLLRAGEPALVASDRMRWRVPVVLALPSTGQVGEVGYLEVDVETGQLSATPEQVSAIDQHAQDLAAHHSTALGSAS